MWVRIQFYLFKRRVTRTCGNNAVHDNARDVYILYNTDEPAESRYIKQTLLPIIEEDLDKTVYFWERDSLAGGSRFESIVGPMADCRTIIILQSKNLFDSVALSRGYSDLSEDGSTGGFSVDSETLTLDDLRFEVKKHNDWTDVALAASLQLIKNKGVCVIKHGDVPSARKVDQKCVNTLVKSCKGHGAT